MWRLWPLVGFVLALTARSSVVDAAANAAGGFVGGHQEMPSPTTLLDQLRVLREQHNAELRALAAEHARQFDSLAGYIRQLLPPAAEAASTAVLPAQQERNHSRRKLEQDSNSAIPEAFSFDNNENNTYHGVRIDTDNALITMGAEGGDVVLVRSAAGTLRLLADEYHVDAAMYVERLVVNGTDVQHLVGVDTTAAVVKFFNVTLTAKTGPHSTSDTVHVEFHIPDQGGWTPPYNFLVGGAAAWSSHQQSFAVSGSPTQARFTLTGGEGWHLRSAKVSIDGEATTSLLCEERVLNGTAPHLTVDIDADCAHVTVVAHTGTVLDSGTADAVNVRFLMDYGWTPRMNLFNQSAAGDEEMAEFQLSSTPSKVALVATGPDEWGFDNLYLSADGTFTVLVCEGTQGSKGHPDFWIDGDGTAGIANELVLDVLHNDCDLTNVTVRAITGAVDWADTASSMHLEFFLPTAGNWTYPFDLFYESGISDVEVATFRLQEAPTLLRFVAGGGDGWSVTQVSVTIDNGEEVFVMCTPIQGESTDESYWIDSDESFGAATLELDIEESCNASVTVTAATGTVWTYSATTGTIYVSFNVAGEFTTSEAFFTGTDSGDTESATFGLPAVPTQIMLSSVSADGWGFDALTVSVRGTDFDIFCAGTQTAPSNTTKQWVDGDGTDGIPSQVVLDITDAGC